MKSRKLSWTREEVILALEMYLDVGTVPTVAECEELSAYLRALPLERHLANDPKFRNETAVRNKLYNLQYLDTNGAQGREKGGAATARVWEEFGIDQALVAKAAAEIRTAFEDVLATEAGTGTVLPDDDYEAEEGAVVLKSHRTRERSAGLARRKRQQVLAATGSLACEACGFDSDALFGVPGVVQCHHLKPVGEMQPGEKTKLVDLRLVCPNCHGLVHARLPWLTWDELTALVSA